MIMQKAGNLSFQTERGLYGDRGDQQVLNSDVELEDSGSCIVLKLWLELCAWAANEFWLSQTLASLSLTVA